MSSAPGSRNNPGQAKPAAEDASSAQRPSDPALLERVLRQTLDTFGPDEPLDPAEMQALREIADRYRGRPLELEPVAVELVAAVIDGICPAKKKTEFWHDLTLQVARILMDDPSAYARMNSLWIRLGGGEL